MPTISIKDLAPDLKSMAPEAHTISVSYENATEKMIAAGMMISYIMTIENNKSPERELELRTQAEKL